MTRCPNCDRAAAGLVAHACASDGDVLAGVDPPPGVAHCGCFYEAAPADVTYHVTRDCRCCREEGGHDLVLLAQAERDARAQGRTLFGADGVRDPEHPCAEFREGTPRGACETDGHYICDECARSVPLCPACGCQINQCDCPPPVADVAEEPCAP